MATEVTGGEAGRQVNGAAAPELPADVIDLMALIEKTLLEPSQDQADVSVNNNPLDGPAWVPAEIPDLPLGENGAPVASAQQAAGFSENYLESLLVNLLNAKAVEASDFTSKSMSGEGEGSGLGWLAAAGWNSGAPGMLGGYKLFDETPDGGLDSAGRPAFQGVYTELGLPAVAEEDNYVPPSEIWGTPQADVLRTYPDASQTVYALEDNDTIYADGNDTIYGGDGADTIYASGSGNILDGGDDLNPDALHGGDGGNIYFIQSYDTTGADISGVNNGSLPNLTMKQLLDWGPDGVPSGDTVYFNKILSYNPEATVALTDTQQNYRTVLTGNTDKYVHDTTVISFEYMPNGIRFSSTAASGQYLSQEPSDPDYAYRTGYISNYMDPAAFRSIVVGDGISLSSVIGSDYADFIKVNYAPITYIEGRMLELPGAWINAGKGPDNIVGSWGNDTVLTDGGKDFIDVGPGVDTVVLIGDYGRDDLGEEGRFFLTPSTEVYDMTSAGRQHLSMDYNILDNAAYPFRNFDNPDTAIKEYSEDEYFARWVVNGDDLRMDVHGTFTTEELNVILVRGTAEDRLTLLAGGSSKHALRTGLDSYTNHADLSYAGGWSQLVDDEHLKNVYVDEVYDGISNFKSAYDLGYRVYYTTHVTGTGQVERDVIVVDGAVQVAAEV